ncbi:hypothetical protein KSF78_0005223 [Schistosoma japonicum]|nr:hypothetical protein KSF78_0005223 [Schistosoma japonicum]
MKVSPSLDFPESATGCLTQMHMKLVVTKYLDCDVDNIYALVPGTPRTFSYRANFTVLRYRKQPRILLELRRYDFTIFKFFKAQLPTFVECNDVNILLSSTKGDKLWEKQMNENTTYSLTTKRVVEPVRHLDITVLYAEITNLVYLM